MKDTSFSLARHHWELMINEVRDGTVSRVRFLCSFEAFFFMANVPRRDRPVDQLLEVSLRFPRLNVTFCYGRYPSMTYATRRAKKKPSVFGALKTA